MYSGNYKGVKTKRILNSLKHEALTTLEFLETVLPTFPDSYKVTKNLLGYMDVPKFDYKKWKREEEKRFYALLAKLRKEGFVKKKKFNAEILWQLTAAGLEKLKVLNENMQDVLPKRQYLKKKSKDLIVVIFDIPEKLKYKRVWLRQQLKNLEFKLLQKSVWVGYWQIPEDFIHDLREIRILPCVHILKVYKTGLLIHF